MSPPEPSQAVSPALSLLRPPGPATCGGQSWTKAPAEVLTVHRPQRPPPRAAATRRHPGSEASQQQLHPTQTAAPDTARAPGELGMGDGFRSPLGVPWAETLGWTGHGLQGGKGHRWQDGGDSRAEATTPRGGAGLPRYRSTASRGFRTACFSTSGLCEASGSRAVPVGPHSVGARGRGTGPELPGPPPSLPQHRTGTGPRVGRTLTLSLDGRAVDGQVGVPGGVPRAQDLSAQAPGDPRELGGVQVEGLPRLHGELGAPAAPGWDAMGALRKGARRPDTAP